jgi:PAS domain S-box-containing protein
LNAAKRIFGRFEQVSSAAYTLKRAVGAVLLMLGTVVPALAQNSVNPKVDELVAAIPGHFPPQYVLDENGELTGFALDVAEQVGALADIRFRYLVENDWVAAVDAVQSGRADILINNGITAERKLLYDFTEPVETFRVSLFVREDTRTIEAWDDLTGRKVAVGKLHVGARMLADRGGIELVLTDDVPDTLFALLSGQADAMVYAEPVAWKVAREMGVDHRLKVVGTPLVEIKRAMSILKGNPELLARLDRAIEAFVGSPEYHQIYAKWYGRPELFWSAARVIWVMGALLALSLATMVGWRQYSVLRLNRDLRESEAALAKAQELAHVGNWRWSIDRNELVSCSEEYTRIYGVGPDEIHALMKQQMERVIHPEDRDRVVEAYRGADEEGLGFEIEYRIVRPDGEVRHVLEIGEAVSHAVGQPREQIGTIQDVTEQRAADERFRQYFDLPLVGSAIGSPD